MVAREIERMRAVIHVLITKYKLELGGICSSFSVNSCTYI